MISYNRLWKLLIDKNLNRTALRTELGISSRQMTKMGKGEPVNVEILANICKYFKCDIGDIMEVLPDEEEKKPN